MLEFARFLSVGLLATTVNYSAFFFLLGFALWEYQSASAAGFLLGVAVGYPLNKAWAFKRPQRTSRNTALLYVCVYLCSLGVSVALITLLVEVGGVNALLANVLCIVVTTLTNFFGTKFIAFGGYGGRGADLASAIVQRPQGKWAIMKHPLFLSVAVIKLIAGSLFASNYVTDLFIPFLDQFAIHPNASPYEYFWAQGKSSSFPYPAFMLYMMASPRILSLFIFGDHVAPTAVLFVYRLPLFLADALIATTFYRWMPQHAIKILLLYWASPVLFYITYIHGQLDVLPIALLIISFRLLFDEKKLVYCAFMLGLAVSAKTNIAAAVPLFVFYQWRVLERITPVAVFTFVFIVTCIAVNAPFLDSAAFMNMVIHNQEQSKIGYAAISIGVEGFHFYLLPAAYFIVLIRLIGLPIRNRDIMILFTGFFFGVMLLLIPPMPGWYFWVIPFFAYFFIRAPWKESVIFFGLQFAYFGFFAFRADSDISELFRFAFGIYSSENAISGLYSSLGADREVFTDVFFTLLQTLLAINCVWIYSRGIGKMKTSRLWSRTFLVSIAGDSGSGKTTVSQGLEELFTARHLTTICGDDMHKWPRGHDNWKEYTHLNPKSNELHLELRYIEAIRRSKTIQRRHYDHLTGRFTEPLAIRPKAIMVLEGLHPYFLQPARDLMDLKVFMKPSDALLLHWKISRDTAARGYTRDQVLASYNARRGDAAAYVEVQEKYADIVISLMPIGDLGTGMAIADVQVNCELILRISNKFGMDALVEAIAEKLGQDIEHFYESDEIQVVKMRRPLSIEATRELGGLHVGGLSDFDIYDPQWRGGWDGVLQLYLAYLVFHESRRYPNV